MASATASTDIKQILNDRSNCDVEEENYPRKQFRRAHWISLNGEWDFVFDKELRWTLPSHIDSWNLKIEVPYAPESIASKIGDTGFHRRCWYQKKFKLQRPEADKKIILHFGAVDYQAKVWLNGQYLGFHEGGHTPFSFEISDHILEQDLQVLTLCADDDPHDLTKPRGKQDWQLNPHSIWYPRTTGIWQSVWLEEVNSIFLDRICWKPNLEKWEVGFECFLEGNCSPDTQLQVKLHCDGRILADDIYHVINNEVHRSIALSDPGIDDYRNELLWSPEKPTLIEADLYAICGGKIVDHVKSYTALRSVSVEHGRFLLNGRPYYMRLILDQGYWPESLMTAPSEDALRRDVELVKAAGFNGVRKHQKVEDPDYLYWADVKGLLVWEEMPSAYRFTHESVERLMREWTEVIDRDRNHPCIVVWVPFNESWGVPDLAQLKSHQSCVQAMYHLTKTLDPTRPVIGNDGWESTATDILGIHDYDDQPERLHKKYGHERLGNDTLNRFRPGGRVITLPEYPHQGQPIMLTEFGGITCIESTVGNTQTWGYSVCQSPAELRKRYEVLVATVHRIECFVGFCYTQFADTFQEANGLFKADRTPKFSLSAMDRATRAAGHTRGELISVPQPPPLPPEELET